jgi:RimJ/RimL family protein N-acetyltransferase
MIEGSIIGLRSIERDDLETLKKWRNYSDYRKNFREIRELNTLNQESWLLRMSESKNDFMFAIVLLETNELIGACGLLCVDWVIRSADVSFYIGKDQEYINRQDYSLESIKLLINFGFSSLNLNKLWMELYEYDDRKYDIFTEVFQFQLDGVLRSNCFDSGKYWNSKIISLLSSDYSIA